LTLSGRLLVASAWVTWRWTETRLTLQDQTPWCHDLLWLFVDANLAFLRWVGRAVWWCFLPRCNAL
jgi:hypothetical protein